MSGEQRKSQVGAAGLSLGDVEAAPGQEFVAGAVRPKHRKVCVCEHSRGTRVSVACRDKDDASGCG